MVAVFQESGLGCSSVFSHMLLKEDALSPASTLKVPKVFPFIWYWKDRHQGQAGKKSVNDQYIETTSMRHEIKM